MTDIRIEKPDGEVEVPRHPILAQGLRVIGGTSVAVPGPTGPMSVPVIIVSVGLGLSGEIPIALPVNLADALDSMLRDHLGKPVVAGSGDIPTAG